MVTSGGKGLGQVRFTEGESAFDRGKAATEFGGKQTRVRAGSDRGGQKARKECVVGRIGKASRRMPFLPTARAEIRAERFEPSISPRLLGGVKAQRVQGEEQDVGIADQMLHWIC